MRRVEGRVVEIPTAFGVDFDEPIDLGIVWKASAIGDCVDILLAKAGLRRVPRPVSTGDASVPTPADQALDDVTDIT